MFKCFKYMTNQQFCKMNTIIISLFLSLCIFNGRHDELNDCYGISDSQMTTDIFQQQFIFVQFYRMLTLESDLLPDMN